MSIAISDLFLTMILCTLNRCVARYISYFSDQLKTPSETIRAGNKELAFFFLVGMLRAQISEMRAYRFRTLPPETPPVPG